MKKAIFFTIDSLLASGIIVIAIILVANFYLVEQQKVNVKFSSQDLVRVFSSTRIVEINNEYVKNLTASGEIININNTVLEQIGEFWANGKTGLALNLTKNLTEIVVPSYYGFSVLVNDEEIYSRSLPLNRVLVSSRKIISGIAKAKPTQGFTARVLLSGIKSKRTSAYVYFGGYEGDGNLTKKLILPNDVISFNSSYVEVSAGGNFDLYINNIFSGTYAKGSAGGGNMLADKWNISNVYLSNFRVGENNVSINFTSGESYISGGFLKVTYITSSYNDTQTLGYEKYLFPGIDGIINLYSSIYPPEEPIHMNITLHFLSEYQVYLTIGNTTVFESNPSQSEQTVVINNSNISGNLNYALLGKKTVPIRLGLKSANITVLGKISDSVLITDRTGSMSSCDVTIACGTPGICDTNPSGGCHQRRDKVAISSDKQFINTILSAQGNRVGLVGYGQRANPVCDFHDVDNDNISLTRRVDDYFNEDCGWTCISCGIVGATQLIKENEALYEFNETFDIDKTQYHVGDSGPVSVKETLNVEIDKSKFLKSRLTIFGKNVDTQSGYRSCVFFNGNYLGRMCIARQTDSGGWHTCSYPLKPEWFVSGVYSGNSWIQTTQADFEAGTLSNVDTTSSPGDVKIGNGSSGLMQLFYDDFDDNDISEYSNINGNWNTVAETGKGFVLRQTSNVNTIIYQPILNFDGSHIVKAIMWNEDNDAAGVAFRLNTADADNFYSCSATSDNGFSAGIWRHNNDISGTPTSNLAGTSWNYVRSRWYNITININETANTIRCTWSSAEAGIELDVTSADDDVRQSGSVGFWLSDEDNFKADLLSVWESMDLGTNKGTILSQVFDAGISANWDIINWTEVVPANANITLQVRTGYTPAPDSSWDNLNWTDQSYNISKGSKVTQEAGRYIQWLATLQSKNVTLYNPNISDVTINYSGYYGSNNVTITGANTNDCFGTAGDQDDWDFKDVKLIAWQSTDPSNLIYGVYSAETTIDDGQESATVSLNINVDKSKMRSSYLEFEAIDVNPSYYDCAYVNGNYIGRVDYQKWSGTNEWQRILFDVPTIYVNNGQNNVTIRSGTTDGCERTSGDNDLWRFRNLNLSVRWTDEPVSYDRFKSMLVMSDGGANTKIGDCADCDPAGARAETIQKACDAHDLYGISIYTVAFGNVGQTAINTLNQTACCDDCSHFYTSNDADELLDIYTQIAQSIGNITFQAQSVNISAGNLVRTALYPDSFIAFNYSMPEFEFNKVPLGFETDRFGNNVSSGILTLYPNTSVLDAKVTSYSGNKWTDNMVVNGNNVYRLSDYDNNYLILGDPFTVNIPTGSLNLGDNSITISTGINSTTSSGGSNDSRVVYTLLLNGFADYSSVVAKSDGCSWTVSFEDGTASTIKVPSDYNGADLCSFSTKTYDTNDALDIVVYQLFNNLDIDKDGKLEINIDENSLDVSTLTVSKVPSLWGPAIIEIRVWE